MKPKVVSHLRVLGALFLLLTLTTLLSFAPLQPWNWIGEVAIAFVMAALVVLFFMKMRHGEPLLALTSVAGLVWLSLLVTFVFLDYLSRPWPR